MYLAMPDAAPKRFEVHTLEVLGCASWITWLEALPPGRTHVPVTHPGRAANIHISVDQRVGPSSYGRTNIMMTWRVSVSRSWGRTGARQHKVAVAGLSWRARSELNTGGVRKVIVDGDPWYIIVAMGYWYELLPRLPYVEGLWSYPGTAEVLCSACVPPSATERIPRRLRARVYVVEGGVWPK